MGRDNHILPKNGRGIFLREELDMSQSSFLANRIDLHDVQAVVDDPGGERDSAGYQAFIWKI
jgi:hypothetical protein